MVKTLFVVVLIAVLSMFLGTPLSVWAVDGNNQVLYTPPQPQDNLDNPKYRDAGPDLEGKRGDIDDKDFDATDEEYKDVDNRDVDVDDRVLPAPKN